MATLYLINNTQGALVATIAPTGENTTSTDLRLYGMGHLLWGEGVDENFYRLLEHFACPEKPLMPDFPQDEIDLASPGSGINDPVNGQIWYNTTKQRPYWYEAVSNTWISIASFFSGPLPPPSPTVGTLWYDPNAQPCPPGGTSQLKVWNGVAFVSVALNYVARCGDTMTGNLILTTVLPADPPLRAVTKQYVDAEIAAETAQNQLDFVNVTGDTMTGALTMSGAQINMGTNRIINVGNAVSTTDALTQVSADPIYVNVTGDTMTGTLIIAAPAAALFVSEGSGIEPGSPRGAYIRSFSLAFNHPSNTTAVVGRGPVTGDEVATRQYVDSGTVPFGPPGIGDISLQNQITSLQNQITAINTNLSAKQFWIPLVPAVDGFTNFGASNISISAAGPPVTTRQEGNIIQINLNSFSFHPDSEFAILFVRLDTNGRDGSYRWGLEFRPGTVGAFSEVTMDGGSQDKEDAELFMHFQRFDSINHIVQFRAVLDPQPSVDGNGGGPLTVSAICDLYGYVASYL